MVKTGVFKKIAALTAAVAMMASFALCASAAEVHTTTQYVEGSNKQEINVIASVSELGGPVEVTYYATNGAKNVYIDQKTASEDGTVSFDYVTDTTDLLSSSVSVGYTDAPAALPDGVPGYTISGEGIEAINVPTEDIDGTHVLNYTLASGKNFVRVESEDATVSSSEYADGKITVVLADAEGNVTLNVVTEQAQTIFPEVEFVDAAFIVSGGARNDVAAEDAGKDVHASAGDRKMTVLAKVTEATEFGILVSTSEIAAGEFAALPAEADSYQALGRNAETGYFAVQLIDTSVDFTEEETWLTAEAQYYTAVYYKHPETNKYTVVAGEMVEIAAAAE